jgi:hypothetical protein
MQLGILIERHRTKNRLRGRARLLL